MGKTGFSPEQLRTFTLVGHRSSGKTSIGDAFLQSSGVTRNMGLVAKQTSLLDYSTESRRRQMTLDVSYAWLPWGDAMLQMTDTPGGVGLLHQTEVLVANTDAFVLAVSAPDGVEAGAERALELADHWKRPGMCVLNKIDREHDRQSCLEQLQRSSAGMTPVLLQIPLRDDLGRVVGVMDMLTQQAFRYHENGSGQYSAEPIPTRHMPEFIACRERAIECVALTSDPLLEQYLEFLTLDDDVFLAGLTEAFHKRKILPVFLMAAERGIGSISVLNFIQSVFPSPVMPPQTQEGENAGGLATILSTGVDASGNLFQVMRLWTHGDKRGAQWENVQRNEHVRVRKYFHLRGPRRASAHTLCRGAIVATWELGNGRPGDTLTIGPSARVHVLDVLPPMITYAIQASCKPEILQPAMRSLALFDHGLAFGMEELTHRPTLSGLSQVQLDRGISWLQERLGCTISTHLPEVGYRETIKASVANVEGFHERRESGLVEEYGSCRLSVAPGDLSEALTFEKCFEEDEIPARFSGSIEDGIRQGMLRGPSGGYPVLGLRVQCVGGDYDYMQSKDEHFKIAAQRGLRLALLEGGTRILEPWSTVHIRIPSKTVGAVLADLAQHRGRISGLEMGERVATISADIPVKELRTFGPRLGALTGGRGWFDEHGTWYTALPDNLVSEVIASSPNKPKRMRLSTSQGLQNQMTEKLGQPETVRVNQN